MTARAEQVVSIRKVESITGHVWRISLPEYMGPANDGAVVVTCKRYEDALGLARRAIERYLAVLQNRRDRPPTLPQMPANPGGLPTYETVHLDAVRAILRPSSVEPLDGFRGCGFSADGVSCVRAAGHSGVHVTAGTMPRAQTPALDLPVCGWRGWSVAEWSCRLSARHEGPHVP